MEEAIEGRLLCEMVTTVPYDNERDNFTNANHNCPPVNEHNTRKDDNFLSTPTFHALCRRQSLFRTIVLRHTLLPLYKRR